MDLPYRAEYAKSGRSHCCGCNCNIPNQDLRLSVRVQSSKFDGKVEKWYHFMCFFTYNSPNSVDDISHFDSLRWSDQQLIKEKIGGNPVALSSSAFEKTPNKRATAICSIRKASVNDFSIEYAKKPIRGGCTNCYQKIMKDNIHICKKTSPKGFYHIHCFAELREDLGFYENGVQLPGFSKLTCEDQLEVVVKIRAIEQNQSSEPEVKKRKDVDQVDRLSDFERQMKRQNDILFGFRDQLVGLPKGELSTLLQYNGQKVPRGREQILDRLADAMTFGVPLPCSKCRRGQFVFNKKGYICQGYLSEYAKCEYTIKNPPRGPFRIPPKLASKHSFLNQYQYIGRERVFREIQITSNVQASSRSALKESKLPLQNMKFVVALHTKREEITNKIVVFGGKVVADVNRDVMAVIASKEDVEQLTTEVSSANIKDIHVVSEDFLSDVPKYVGKIPELVTKKSICPWGSNPLQRLPPTTSTRKRAVVSARSVSRTIKVKLKGGIEVDPDSALEHIAHVYRCGNEIYNAVLTKTNIQMGKNSFYKIQLLESDVGSRFWIFRSWGRTGTDVGDHMCQEMGSLEQAKNQFYEVFKEKTGTPWEDRHNMIKIPGRFYPVDIDYSENTRINFEIADSSSLLPVPIQNLMKMIFDFKSMQKTMLEFELDADQMPLGKLSKTQIQQAYGVLSELQYLVASNAEQPLLIAASNHFYHLIPHSCGMGNLPIINSRDMIKNKRQMLDYIMDVEIACNLMKTAGSQCSVDDCYKQLNAEISVLERTADEYTIIEEYVRNTHAVTHNSYSLEVQEIFVVNREGESKRYQPFNKLHNRKLLWHGSRLTNYVGILSQGLRIAPPEAPVTGYMFGKGIYFADMVSKSANYCHATGSGLLLLCEVALGDMHECYHANDRLVKAPHPKHSVKGVGKTYPNPQQSTILNDVEVPLGQALVNENFPGTLLYNEYIVYDAAQVHIKYLVKANFLRRY